MTVLERVRDFVIFQEPNAVCDDCISARLNLSVRQHANHKTRELAEGLSFDRRKQYCSLCGREKKSISYAGGTKGAEPRRRYLQSNQSCDLHDKA
jgi:hypothetical protein